MGLLTTLSRWLHKEVPLTNIAAGHTAPEFSLKALDGSAYSLSSLLKRGPVMVVFFKVSCPVCQFTFPFLQRIYERHAHGEASFLAVSQDDARSTKKFIKEYGVKFPALLDEDHYPVSNAYGLTNVPTIFLIAPDGTVQVSCVGFSKSDLEKIAAALAERSKMAAAPLFRPAEVVPDYKPG
jgi:peroxiredoxin